MGSFLAFWFYRLSMRLAEETSRRISAQIRITPSMSAMINTRMAD